LKNFLVITIATGFGLGYSPVAPGTAGSVLGLALGYILMRMGVAWHVGLTAIIFVVGVWAAGEAEALFGQKDSGKIVVDEVVGMSLSLLLMPATALYLVAGFAFFRFFDILKPFPVNRIDRKVGGGFGVMLDDVAAGIYANIGLRALGYILG